MNQKEITEKVEQYVLHTYNRFPVAIDQGEGLTSSTPRERNTWTSWRGSRFTRWATISRSTMRP